MAELKDEDMMDQKGIQLSLAGREEDILELYDKLQTLRLEIAVINAQKSHVNGKECPLDESQASDVMDYEIAHAMTDGSLQPSDDEIRTAQDALLEARAKHKLRNDAVESVIIAKPILEAVHNGTDASPVELDLRPYIERRDDASISVARQATAKGELRSQQNEAQSETLRATRRNVELTAELLRLAEEVRQKKAGPVNDPRARRELDKLESEVKVSRQRWRIMKAVAGGIVAGSGVDWARDDELRDIVLDPEDEDKL